MVRTAPWFGLLAESALLLGLALWAGLGWWGLATGALYAVVAAGLLDLALRRAGMTLFGPANLVTLLRAVLVGGVLALATDSLVAGGHIALLVGLSTVSLVLDAVDGRVARRTGSVSRLGARFDLEVDAFLILVLSIVVSRSLGDWVLAIGAGRYVLVAAGRAWPWLRHPAPPRYWCKVVAAAQGATLTVVLTGWLPDRASQVGVALCLILLAESFGREAWWKWQRRSVGPVLRPRRSPNWSQATDRHRMPCTAAEPRRLHRSSGN